MTLYVSDLAWPENATGVIRCDLSGGGGGQVYQVSALYRKRFRNNGEKSRQGVAPTSPSSGEG